MRHTVLPIRKRGHYWTWPGHQRSVSGHHNYLFIVIELSLVTGFVTIMRFWRALLPPQELCTGMFRSMYDCKYISKWAKNEKNSALVLQKYLPDKMKLFLWKDFDQNREIFFNEKFLNCTFLITSYDLSSRDHKNLFFS